MHISWGKKVAWVGESEEFCELCNRNTSHTVHMRYGVVGTLFIFNFAGSKEYFLSCERCGAVAPGDPAMIEAQFPPAHIPFLDRFGCATLIVVVAVVIGLFALARSRPIHPLP